MLFSQNVLLKGEKLSFDGNVFLLFHCCFRFFLRNKQFQNAMFKLSLNILLLYVLAYIKASAAGSCVTLPADVMTGFFLLPSYSAQTSYLLPAYRPVLHTQISLFYVPSMPYIYNLPGCTDIEISGIKFHSHRILSFYVPFLRRDLHSCSHHFGQTDFYHTPALLLYSLTLTSLFCISCTLIARMTGTSF